jgi:hypothetical protein
MRDQRVRVSRGTSHAASPDRNREPWELGLTDLVLFVGVGSQGIEAFLQRL